MWHGLLHHNASPFKPGKFIIPVALIDVDTTGRMRTKVRTKLNIVYVRGRGKGGKVSEETVMLRRWGVETNRMFGFINRVKVIWPPLRDSSADPVRANLTTLETSDSI